MKTCFECGKPAVNDHHVVPQSKGGKKTVPLCSRCHQLAHGFNGVGQPLGRPPKMQPEIEARAVALMREGYTPGQVATLFNSEGVPCNGRKWRGGSFDRVMVRNGIAPPGARGLGMRPETARRAEALLEAGYTTTHIARQFTHERIEDREWAESSFRTLAARAA